MSNVIFVDFNLGCKKFYIEEEEAAPFAKLQREIAAFSDYARGEIAAQLYSEGEVNVVRKQPFLNRVKIT